MNSVSVPEKTLEHWSSQYISLRYHSKAGLWWPSLGEDVDVRWLPNQPGKIVQLELKTTTVSGPSAHVVKVDLGQLWDYYHKRSPGRRPFYALPRPDWTGTLEAAARAAGRPITELAFARSGSPWWFADWMIVLTTTQVASVLSTELARHGCSTRGVARPTLVRFDIQPNGRVVLAWGNQAKPPAFVEWRDFWPELDRCGRPGWPQLIRLPASMVTARRYTHVDIATLHREAGARRAAGEWNEPEELVTLEPDDDGGFLRVDDTSPEPSTEEAGIVGGGETNNGDRRQTVFLPAG